MMRASHAAALVHSIKIAAKGQGNSRMAMSAQKALKEMTGQDFAEDWQSWEKWFRENRPKEYWFGSPPSASP